MDLKGFILKYGFQLGSYLYLKVKNLIEDKKEAADKLKAFEISQQKELSEEELREAHKDFLK